MDFPISVPSVGLVGGKFVDENSLVGTPGSLIPAQWGNAVTEEILNVIEQAGLFPDEDNNTQLQQAILSIIAANVPQATEAAAGRAKVATQVQVTTGTDDSTIVSPKKLAVRLAAGAPAVGSARNGRMVVAAPSASATYTADEVVVKSALGGQAWALSSFNKTVNLASVGAGGMDIGAAPVNGYVALYAVFNPTAQASALLAVNATSVAAPQVYGGGNMPSGYTASALLTVVPTNGSSQFRVVQVRDRLVGIVPAASFSTSSVVSNAPTSVGSTIPLNAVEISGELSISTSVAANLGMQISSDVNSTCRQNASLTFTAAGQGLLVSFSGVIISTPQTVVINTTATAGSPAFIIYITGYKI